jgi:GNAT superfamily N-acetyltransferase
MEEATVPPPAGISVRSMRESDIPAARDVFRVAFGTYLGLPDPKTFAADREYVGTRWRADPAAALVAEAAGALVGSNFATCWGSFAFFGPLTIAPEYWNRGVAQHLLGPTMELFQGWGVRAAGLYTFSHSPKHVTLYQKFGFWPRFLTALMSKPVAGPGAISWSKYSQIDPAERAGALAACRELTDAIFEGLDVSREIVATAGQDLGDTVLLWGGDSLEAFAVCHCGADTEAGARQCYVKFAAARPGAKAEKAFDRLLDACQALAAERGLERIEAGVNLNRSQAYRTMLQRGFRATSLGIAMHRPDAPAYNRPDVYAMDDWR